MMKLLTLSRRSLTMPNSPGSKLSPDASAVAAPSREGVSSQLSSPLSSLSCPQSLISIEAEAITKEKSLLNFPILSINDNILI